MKIRIWSVILILGFAMMLQACDQSQASGDAKAEEDEEEVVLVPVEVESTQLETVYATYPGTTTLEADREAKIVAKTGGVILKVLVEEGDKVAAGQVVAELDRQRLAIELQRAKADLDRLDNEYNRSKELFSKKLVSSDAFEKARFSFDAQKAAAALIELELSYTQVRAAIDGVISERMIKEGNLVTLNQELFTITDFDPLLAVLFVPERELPKLAIQQHASMIFDGIGSEEFIGEVLRISPIVDPKTGTSKVTIALNEPDPRLKPGMFGRVNVIHDIHEQAVTVSQNAVITEDRGSYVYVHTDGQAKRRDITTGYSSSGRIEVLEGLAMDEQVITNGKGSVADETPVEVINLPESEAEQTAIASQETADTETNL